MDNIELNSQKAGSAFLIYSFFQLFHILRKVICDYLCLVTWCALLLKVAIRGWVPKEYQENIPRTITPPTA